jgi:zinc and cadmium transporter
MQLANCDNAIAPILIHNARRTGCATRSGVPPYRSEVVNEHLLSLAAGALLATALLHLLPGAFQSDADAKVLFVKMPARLVFLLRMGKAELWLRGHEHQAGQDPLRQRHHTTAAPRAGGWTVLTGDSIRCFCDGVLIASAFVAAEWLVLIAALAVLAHKVPHHIGDLVVLRQVAHRRAFSHSAVGRRRRSNSTDCVRA